MPQNIAFHCACQSTANSAKTGRDEASVTDCTPLSVGRTILPGLPESHHPTPLTKLALTTKIHSDRRSEPIFTLLQLPQPFHTPKTAIMPKEKATTRGAKKGGKADGGKKKKDPNMPKRGLSAYMFFANEQRDNVREENPGIKFGEVGKLLGERWKGLNEKQKTPYEAKAAADKKRYEEEKKAYLNSAAADEDEDDE
ncbi:unnamed protein product [Zymoseptoria tritici ST99CH_3D7]|uniref:Non-histone chromosomal protein 6 n=2 Tax=Zymoseptoria tritici TaxID=1047171 RepID=A0A1X7RIH2_ZYMT9|nr:unnamed protein product [Zymoseptoria tritici ST99CH_3D7]SMR45748.1 unnamed protein product [Zymoseptoria tritici ST99CH_1E4]